MSVGTIKAKTMNTHNWTNNELRILEEWDWMTRYIDAQKPEIITSRDRINKLLLEAKLMISNKLIIVYNYISIEPVAIMSFKEYLTERENGLKKVEVPLQFHPINFNNIWEYKAFLSKARVRMLERH